MDIITVALSAAKGGSAHHDLLLTNEVETLGGAGAENLDVETFASNPIFPADRKWAIRFRSDGTITIVLGMKDYGGLVFWVLRRFGSGSPRGPISAGPHLLQCHSSGCPADAKAAFHCIPSRPYWPSRERGRRYY
jgi:hypothetical protein